MTREDIEFIGEGGVTLRGWFYHAAGDAEKSPVVVMAHGMSGVKELHLDDYAEVFSAGGLNVIVYDHRNFGASDGMPRQEVDPIHQYRDYQNAITYALTRDDVDPDRVGVWGTSYSGGHALMVAAIDKRVKAVVSQVPFISGPATQAGLIRPDHMPGFRAAVQHDRMQRYLGHGEVATLPAVTDDPHGQAVMTALEAHEWFTTTAAERAPSWRNEITVRSLELTGDYDPGSWIHRISPTPLLMIVADGDVVAPAGLAFDAFERAREPKRLFITAGGHFDAYAGQGFEECSAAARYHFTTHLLG